MPPEQKRSMWFWIKNIFSKVTWGIQVLLSESVQVAKRSNNNMDRLIWNDPIRDQKCLQWKVTTCRVSCLSGKTYKNISYLNMTAITTWCIWDLFIWNKLEPYILEHSLMQHSCNMVAHRVALTLKENLLISEHWISNFSVTFQALHWINCFL